MVVIDWVSLARLAIKIVTTGDTRVVLFIKSFRLSCRVNRFGIKYLQKVPIITTFRKI